LEGNQGKVRPFLQSLPGLTSRTEVLPTSQIPALAASRGRVELQRALEQRKQEQGEEEEQPEKKDPFKEQVDKQAIIHGTPTTVLPKIRNLLEEIRPGAIFFWDADGSMDHEDAMRSLRLMGEEVLPAVREMGAELALEGAFEIDPATNERIAAAD
ncbi:MAG: hypothetical protein OXG42_07460, partial [Chloroflexi bacterium]|nr:hypothetical protein [Chloroflexota bacterium]